MSSFRFVPLVAIALGVSSCSAEIDSSGEPKSDKPAATETTACTDARTKLGEAIGGILDATAKTLLVEGPERAKADERLRDAQSARAAAADAVAKHCPSQ